jgi:hypothetical protein
MDMIFLSNNEREGVKNCHQMPLQRLLPFDYLQTLDFGKFTQMRLARSRFRVEIDFSASADTLTHTTAPKALSSLSLPSNHLLHEP